MRSISISEPVWQALAAQGKFGETEDDVLRRVFGLPPAPEAAAPPRSGLTQAKPQTRSAGMRRRSFATNRMSSYISGNELRVAFATGESNAWKLPTQGDREGVRAVRDKAVAFAEQHGATVGQTNAVRKTLTNAGFHVLK
jgi:negative regulator of replication initiation